MRSRLNLVTGAEADEEAAQSFGASFRATGRAMSAASSPVALGGDQKKPSFFGL